jgi:hypothetical protein
VYIKASFELLGPTPRIIQLLSQPDRLEEYKDEVDIAISEITPDKLRKLVSDTRSLSMETDKGMPHKLSLISRMECDEVHSARVVTPVTELVKSRLARQLRVVSRNQQIELYQSFSKSPQTSTYWNYNVVFPTYSHGQSKPANLFAGQQKKLA